MHDLLRITIFTAFVIAATLGTATAQHPPEHQALHEQFYSTWKSPYENLATRTERRTAGCCGISDCFPADVKYVGGRLWMHPRVPQQSAVEDRWYLVPASLLENNQPDPRESPDGQSHVCIVGDQAFCAILGSGQ